MGKKSDSPDYVGAALTQGQLSRENTEAQTWANRPTQNTPWGQVDWSNQPQWDPTTNQWINRWQQDVTLNPAQQWALENEQYLQGARAELGAGMMDRVADEFGDTMDWSQFGDVQDLEFDPTQMRQRAEDAAYQRDAMRLNPRFQQQEEQLDIRLRNQGLRPGDQAYDSAMETLGLERNDAFERARLGAVGQGRAESGQLWQQQMGAANYANQLRQQQIKEEMSKRGFSLNEINALLTGQQVQNPQFEDFATAQRSETPPILQATVNQGNFDQAANQGFMSGIGGLAGLGLQAYTGGLFG